MSFRIRYSPLLEPGDREDVTPCSILHLKRLTVKGCIVLHEKREESCDKKVSICFKREKMVRMLFTDKTIDEQQRHLASGALFVLKTL